METKFCPDCRRDMPVTEFTRNRRSRDGLAFYCAPCARSRHVASRRRRLGPPRTRVAQRPRDVPEGTKWCPQCDLVLPLNYHFKRRYGITVERFDAMVAEQGGVCAICREAPAEQVDHDHVTGRVRGLPCFNCNGALGQFRDRPDLMLLAVHYLERGAAATAGRPDGASVGFAIGFDDVSPRPPGVPQDLPGEEAA